eukprot:329786-Pleurochrysis_carterae.AAC.4
MSKAQCRRAQLPRPLRRVNWPATASWPRSRQHLQHQRARGCSPGTAGVAGRALGSHSAGPDL